MNNPRDKSSQESSDPGSAAGKPAATVAPSPAASSGPASTDGSVDQAADSKRSGRVAHDERGNSVWEWQLETGVYSRDITTQRLKKLDLNDLSIADTAMHPRPPGMTDPQDPGSRTPGSGFNPYDNSTTGRGNVASDPYNSAGRGALKSDPRQKAPARKPVDLKKLEEWIELRKRVEQNKREQEDD